MSSIAVLGYVQGCPASILLDPAVAFSRIDLRFCDQMRLSRTVRRGLNDVAQESTVGPFRVRSQTGEYHSTFAVAVGPVPMHDIVLGLDWFRATHASLGSGLLFDPPRDAALLPGHVWSADPVEATPQMVQAHGVVGGFLAAPSLCPPGDVVTSAGCGSSPGGSQLGARSLGVRPASSSTLAGKSQACTDPSGWCASPPGDTSPIIPPSLGVQSASVSPSTGKSQVCARSGINCGSPHEGTSHIRKSTL